MIDLCWTGGLPGHTVRTEIRHFPSRPGSHDWRNPQRTTVANDKVVLRSRRWSVRSSSGYRSYVFWGRFDTSNSLNGSRTRDRTDHSSVAGYTPVVKTKSCRSRGHRTSRS